MGVPEGSDMLKTARTVLPDEVREPPVFLTREERVRRFKLDVGVEALHWHDWYARASCACVPVSTQGTW